MTICCRLRKKYTSFSSHWFFNQFIYGIANSMYTFNLYFSITLLQVQITTNTSKILIIPPLPSFNTHPWNPPPQCNMNPSISKHKPSNTIRTHPPKNTYPRTPPIQGRGCFWASSWVYSLSPELYQNQWPLTYRSNAAASCQDCTWWKRPGGCLWSPWHPSVLADTPVIDCEVVICNDIFWHEMRSRVISTESV